MTANELRIGNWVEDNAIVIGSKITQINNITNEDQSCILLKPIPLTEEWLLKFGFERDIYHCPENNFDMKDGWSFLIEDLGIYIKFHEDFSFSIYDESDDIGLLIKDPEHVHQLQNLYFALTGEELKIKYND